MAADFNCVLWHVEILAKSAVAVMTRRKLLMTLLKQLMALAVQLMASLKQAVAAVLQLMPLSGS